MSRIVTDDDPVVTYDVMREAANRLGGAYLANAYAGSATTASAIAAIQEINRKIYAIDIHDLAAQRALTVSLRARYRAHLANGRPPENLAVPIARCAHRSE